MGPTDMSEIMLASHRRFDSQCRARSARPHAGQAIRYPRTGGKAGTWGVFDDVDDAVAPRPSAEASSTRWAWMHAARPSIAFARSASTRRRCLACEEFEETKIGRLKHKVEKLIVAGEKTPGVEFLTTAAFSGENGITLKNLPRSASSASSRRSRIRCRRWPAMRSTCSPPATRSCAIRIPPAPDRLQGHAAFQPGDSPGDRHRQSRSPSSARRRSNRPRRSSIIATSGCSASPAARRLAGRLCEARSGPSSPGPGNPPVVVDETADLDNAARSIIVGAAYDNNLLCIGEKEVFAVAAIFDE